MGISASNPQELVVLAVALAGLIPVVFYRHRLQPLHLAVYIFLLVGAVATNVENVLWHDTANFVEHSVGNMGAGLAFLALAVLQRQRMQRSSEDEPGEDA